MKSKMWKSTFREIWQSFGRFMAIFAITALGVSLFSGLKVLHPAMVKTTDAYYEEKEFYNYRILSDLGFEQEDLEYLSGQEEVRYAEGIVTFDMLCNLEEESAKVLKVYSMPKKVNGVELLFGRMPENSQECIVDSAMYTEEVLEKKISLSVDNEEEDLENFAVKEFTIVGIAQASNYIQFERGNTSVGNGKISGFLYVPMDSFDVDCFTEILIKFEENFEIYSDAYEDYMDAKEQVWEDLAQQAADWRYERIVTEATEELNDAKREFSEEKADAERELENARLELADAYQELRDGEAELRDAAKVLADAKVELADGRAELEENRETLKEAEYELGYHRKMLEEAQVEIDENWKILETEAAKLSDGKKELEAGQAKLNASRLELEAGQAKLEELKTFLDGVDNEISVIVNQDEPLPEEQIEIRVTQLERMVDGVLQQMQPEEEIEPLEEITLTFEMRLEILKQKINPVKMTAEAQETELQNGLAQLQAAQKEIDANRVKIEAGEKQLKEAEQQLEAAQKEIDDGLVQLEEGYEQWEDGLRQFSEGEAKLLEGEAELQKGEAELKKAKAELADGWEEYYDGQAEYEEGYQEFLTEIADAEAEIGDAEAEIADLERPDSYVLGRETNMGYACMENDSAIVNGIANVFPVFFYAVAALVCMTTMNRMVEEQRTQIGVLKALGYSEASIMGKYLFYSGAAAISGSLVGYFFGTWFFPYMIWIAYSSMYDVAEIQYVFDAGLLIFSLLISSLCSMGVTYVSCKNELSEAAAELMRPKAPKAGKRIFLEYIPWIWKPMKFLHKVSYRNVFRYKKRFFMMVIGISGCTGLLVTGFGVQDSIANIANDQYGRIQVVDINVLMSEAVDDTTDEMIQRVAGDRVKEYTYVLEKSMDLVTEEAVKSINLVAMDEGADISPYVMLPDEKTGEILEYPGLGECILTDKLAKTYELSVGDTITLRDENHHSMEVVLTGIAENYLYNFVYMTTQTYEECLGEKAQVKSIYMNLAEDTDPHQMTADFMKEDSVASAMVSSDSKERFTSMIDSLDLMILMITACAACLAFIVLYNLTNINITERIREIATIKVLGFYRKETASYVFRENLILTAFGAVAGLFLGKLFHGFVMSQVQVDQVSFAVRILPKSYLFSIVLTFVFAILINLCMMGKLDKVSMTESLKSVD